MNKEYKIKLDLNKKLYNKKMAFNQFDENVNDFYIEVTKNNEVVKDLDKSIITLVAIKPNNAVDAQFIEVKEGQIYADLKPSMCDLVGNYQAKAMIVLEGKIITTDTMIYSVNEDKIISRLNEDVVSDERFALFTDALARLSTIEISEEQRVINEAERILSEENRKIEEAKRVEAELIRQHEEADRAKYDATRESNENIRKQNESIRLVNETNRIDEEAKRVDEENKRKLAEEERNANYNFMTEDEERRRLEANAHKEAEVLRVQAETNRVNEETKRRTTEQARVSAENTRVSNENTREANEVTRQTNETQRVEAETQRQSRYNSFILDAEANANNFENYTNTAKVKEEERKSNELDRKSQEAKRVSNEVERISNENTRKANEVVREKNETSRQYVFENKVNEVDKKIIEINATKDNFVSSVNTKVDNKISELDNAKSDMTTTVSNKVNEVETRFNALTSSQQQDAEVIYARVDFKGVAFDSLKERIDYTDKLLRNSTVSTVVTESDFTTVEATNNGYFEDVKLEGKTLVNLATQPTNNGSINNQYATISTVTNIKPSTEYTYIIRNNGSETLKLYLNTNGGFDWFDLDVEANSTVIGKARTLPTIDGDIWLSLSEAETIEQNLQVVLLEGDHTQNPPSFFEGLKSVGEDTDEIVVSSVNSDETQSDKKRLLYYNEETQSWEKPILRQWDSIEKHADGKYYYHVRSIEEEYTEGDETVTDYITDMTKTVKKNSSEKVYECTNIDLITYANETNYIIECGAITPKSTFEIHCNISNVVSMLQKKASISESNLLTSNGGGNGDHTHSNLSVLNNITQTKVNEWNSKADSTHSHSEYANYSHTHNASEIEGLENVDIDLSDYYTKSETYNKTEIDSKISNMGTGGSVDLSNYYTKSETDEAMNDKANKIHTHNEYLTELPTHTHSEYLKELPTHEHSEYLTELPSHEHEQYLTEHQDISHKADKSDIYTKFETDNKISEEIARAQLGGSGEVDLSAYATKNYVNEEIAKIEVGDKHTHSNLSILNNITQTKVNEWNGKANASHTHSDYANKTHTHTEYASSSHTHNYADASHTHSEYAASNHTHDYASTSHTHSDYANKAHTHSTSDISNLSSYVSSLITDDVYINSLKSTIDTLSSELAKVKKDIEALKNNSGSSNIPVTGINCSEWEVNLQVGQTRQIIASVIPSSATNKLIHWYSDNTLAVDVSSNGLITAKGVGYSKVTATTDDGGHKYDIRVTVTASSGGGSGSTTTSGIKVAPESVSIERGKTVDVTISFGSDVINKNIECMSSSGAIASVSDLGSHRYRITGVGQGQTSIRFRTSDGRFEVSCSVTVTVPSSGGGGEMTSNEYEESCKSEYILDKMYPMGQAHEAIPNGNITGWKHNSRWENQYRPTAMAHSCGQSGCPGTGAFQALGCWSNIYRVEGTPFTQNTAVEMKDIKVYGWYNGAWELVQHLPVPNGNFYPESFGGDVNKYFADSVKQTSTSKTIILREKNKIDAMNWNTGQLQTENCMYHPFSNVKNFDTKYEYIYTCIDLRKVKWDENGVDDRDNTHYCSNCGGDWWLAEGLMFHDSWQHNKGVCQPKFIEITNEWRRFSMTTVPQGWSHGFPV